eukprot:scaffold233742_cov17-Tisochrysis_lutea.AAC.1
MQYAEQPWAIIAHVHAVGTHEHYKCPAGPRSHTHSQNAIALYTPSAIVAEGLKSWADVYDLVADPLLSLRKKMHFQRRIK